MRARTAASIAQALVHADAALGGERGAVGLVVGALEDEAGAGGGAGARRGSRRCASAWSRPSSWQGPAISVSGRRFETASSPIRTVLASVIASSPGADRWRERLRPAQAGPASRAALTGGGPIGWLRQQTGEDRRCSRTFAARGRSSPGRAPASARRWRSGWPGSARRWRCTTTGARAAAEAVVAAIRAGGGTAVPVQGDLADGGGRARRWSREAVGGARAARHPRQQRRARS